MCGAWPPRPGRYDARSISYSYSSGEAPGTPRARPSPHASGSASFSFLTQPIIEPSVTLRFLVAWSWGRSLLSRSMIPPYSPQAACRQSCHTSGVDVDGGEPTVALGFHSAQTFYDFYSCGVVPMNVEDLRILKTG